MNIFDQIKKLTSSETKENEQVKTATDSIIMSREKLMAPIKKLDTATDNGA